MKRLLKMSALLLGLAFAATASLRAEDYVELAAPQPTNDPKKIEVVELFSYACPHCFHFDPMLSKWAAAQPKDVEFLRMPVVFRPAWEPFARAYYVAEMLGVLDKMHDAIFKAIHEKKQSLETEDAVAKVFVEQGIDEKQFHDAYNSFGVAAKINRAKQMTVKYGISGVPTLVINGKYRTSAGEAGSHEGMLKAADALIAKERAAR